MSAPSPPRPPRPPRLLPQPLGWLGASGLAILLLALTTAALKPSASITDVFLLGQDQGVLAMSAIVLTVMGLLSFEGRGRSISVDGRVLIGVAVVAAFLAAWAGAKLVFHDTPVSADEAMARFDATVMAHGRLFAPVPPEMRAFETAMAPSFLMPFKGGAAWISAYLPVNGAIQALFMMIGDAALANAVLGGVAVLGVYGCGRRLWPERPARAWIAAVMVASSPQVLVNAMTPYATTPHLAFDVVWLWLVLSPSWRSQLLAGAVGFAGVGLHQVIFHPMFAAPFVLRFWMQREFGKAGFHTAVYLLAGAFWSTWFFTASAFAGLAPAPHHGSALFTFLDLVRHPNPWGPGIMTQNLARFIAWQNLLLWPLWLFGAGLAFQASRTWTLDWDRALALVPVSTFFCVLTTQPFQGHGWGYRYLHGALGAMALTAAAAWTTLLDRLDARGRTAARQGFLICLAVTLGGVLPLRLWQVATMARPVTTALAEIARRPDRVVLVEPGLFYGWDLARNDPYLRGRPLIMAMELLKSDDLARLCAQGSVGVFSVADGLRAGYSPMAVSPADSRRIVELSAVLADPPCAHARRR